MCITATWGVCGLRVPSLDTLRYLLLTWHLLIGIGWSTLDKVLGVTQYFGNGYVGPVSIEMKQNQKALSFRPGPRARHMVESDFGPSLAHLKKILCQCILTHYFYNSILWSHQKVDLIVFLKYTKNKALDKIWKTPLKI